MRLFLYVLLLIGIALPAYAQNPVYNTSGASSRSSSGAVPIYNTRSSGSSRSGPISIKNLANGKTDRGSYKNYESAYGFGRENEKKYTTSMSPKQIKAKRAQDQARAQRYAAQAKARSEERRREAKARQAKNRSETVEDKTREFTSRFQNTSGEETTTASNTRVQRQAAPQRNPVFLQRNNDLAAPQRVFNSNF